MDAFIKDLYSLCKNDDHNQAKVVINVWIQCLTLNIVTKIIARKKYFNGGNDAEARRIGKIIKEFMHISGVSTISNLIPFLGWFDLQGRLKSMKCIARELDSVLGTWVE